MYCFMALTLTISVLQSLSCSLTPHRLYSPNTQCNRLPIHMMAGRLQGARFTAGRCPGQGEDFIFAQHLRNKKHSLHFFGPMIHLFPKEFLKVCRCTIIWITHTCDVVYIKQELFQKEHPDMTEKKRYLLLS